MISQIFEKIQSKQNSWTYIELKNNLNCVHVPMPESNKLFIGFYVKAGSINETKKNSGVSHFLEHMMFRGSKKYPSSKLLSQAFENLGGEWNAATSYEHTEFTYSGLSLYFDKIMSLFSEFLISPLFLDFEKEKNIILREIEDELNEFGFFTDLDHQINKLFWPESSLALPITGTKKSIQGLTKEQLIDYYKTHYNNKECVLCIIGGDSKDINSKSISRYFSNFSLHSPKKQEIFENKSFIYSGPVCKLIPNSDNQYSVQISFVCNDSFSKNKAGFKLLSYVLTGGFSSLLSYKIREELGLVYDINASIEKFSDRGVFSIYFATTQPFLEETIHEIFKIIADLKKHEVPIDIFERAKSQFMVETALLLEDFESLSYYLARQILSKLKPKLDQDFFDVNKYSIKQLQVDILDTFQLKNCGIVMLGEDDQVLKQKILSIIKSYL